MPVATQQTDPTRTATVRRRFAQHLRGRFDAIRFHLTSGIIENDAFGLTSSGISIPAVQVDTDDDVTPAPREFDFPSDSDKAEAFESWLDGALERELLEKYEGDRYIRQSYGRGTKHAGQRLREEGFDVSDEAVESMLRTPIHRDKLELLYTRSFEELEGITQAAAQEMRRELTEGLSQGLGPREIARGMNDRVEAVGKTRATVMARTEVVRSHATASLSRYEQVLGPEAEVSAKVEWLSAGDRRVCETCKSLGGQTFTIKEARGKLPIHPQCRCTWIIANTY